MDTTEAQRVAERMGLDKLDEYQLRELAAAIKSAEALASRLPRDLDPSEECAHAFRLAPAGQAQP